MICPQCSSKKIIREFGECLDCAHTWEGDEDKSIVEWHRIEESKPRQHMEVLVASDLHEDDALFFFIAYYCETEEEWHTHHHFAPENSPMVSIYRKVLTTDRWCYLPDPDR